MDHSQGACTMGRKLDDLRTIKAIRLDGHWQAGVSDLKHFGHGEGQTYEEAIYHAVQDYEENRAGKVKKATALA